MKKLKIYLDTSIINFLKIDDSPDYRKYTEMFFEEVVVPEKVEVFVSKIVLGEINNTTNLEKKEELLNVFKIYPNIKTLVSDDNNVKEINLWEPLKTTIYLV